MKLKLLLISLLALGMLNCQTVLAQDIYIYKFEAFESHGSVYQLVNDNTLIWLGTLNSDEPIFADIAVGPSGDIYGLSQDGSIRLMNFDEGTTTEVGHYSAITVHTAFTCDSQSNFYTLDFNNDLVSYNILTEEETIVMPVGEISPGDLTFYNGSLVFPSGDGVLKSIDLATEEIEAIYTLTPEMITLTDIWGIANSFHSCGNEQLIVSNFSNQLFKINVIENSFVEMLPVFDTDAGGIIYGMASSGDLLASDCDGFVGLAENSSEDRFSVFPNPAKDIINIPQYRNLDHLEIIDIEGRIVKSVQNPESQLYVGDLTPGFYIARLSYAAGNVDETKMVITR